MLLIISIIIITIIGRHWWGELLLGAPLMSCGIPQGVDGAQQLAHHPMPGWQGVTRAKWHLIFKGVVHMHPYI